jgi:hypothetical protein
MLHESLDSCSAEDPLAAVSAGPEEHHPPPEPGQEAGQRVI